MGTPLYGERGIKFQVVWGGKSKEVKFASKAVFELNIVVVAQSLSHVL